MPAEQAKIFERDIFFETTPKFIATTESISDIIIFLLKSKYPSWIGRVTDISQVSGNEVNSNNYKIETTTRTYVLKRFPSMKERTNINKLLKLNNALIADRIPFPRALPCLTGELIVEYDNALWCLFEFMPGNYFAGENDEELQSAGRMIGKLFQRLREIPYIARQSQAVA